MNPTTILAVQKLQKLRQDLADKHASELAELKEKERQLYIDALNEWAEIDPLLDFPDSNDSQ